jgi:monoterpene epsilon-lactone hydrolase
MSPREELCDAYSAREKDNNEAKTVVYHTPDGAPYVICKSSEPFVNPTTPRDAKPEEINAQLNLDLGQTIITRNNKTLLWIVNFLDQLLFQWWEGVFFLFWCEMVPLSLKRALCHGGWNVYFYLHKLLLGKRTGLHPSQSFEYHALTTLMWGFQFIAITPRRIRFSLSQIYVVTPNPAPEKERIEQVEEIPTLLDVTISPEQKDHCTVKGWYISPRITDEKDASTKHSRKIIFWIYGGAYLGGDVRGNSSSADWMGQRCQMDVFIPEFRLAPESNLDDVLWDVCLAYKWLCSRVNDPSQQIFLLGLSSGGAIVSRLMQLISQHSRSEDSGVPSYFSPVLEDTIMPKGGVLFGPYVDYDRIKKGSFLHYPRHDLIVSEAVQQYGLPYLEDFIPKREGIENPRREYSPIHRSMKGLPPLCVIVSEHEAVYDMTIQLVNNARSDGVKVTVGVWKYMCHVFSFLLGWVPEGRISMDFVVDWLLEQAEERE